MSRVLMADLITGELILPSLHASNKRSVIEKLSRFVASSAGLDEKLLKRAVLSRADLSTFGVGGGIAIPHATAPGVSQPLGAFARLTKPVDFGAADGRPADLVMLLIAAQGEDGILLRTLSSVARRFREPDVAANLRAARSVEAVHIILTTDVWRGRDLVLRRKLAA
jgi:PTS system nitrogen regulatory IIA component